MENKNEYDKRSQRKGGNVYKTFAFVCHHSI